MRRLEERELSYYNYHQFILYYAITYNNNSTFGEIKLTQKIFKSILF